MLSNRGSGILLHPTSLPGMFGSGDLGADAYKFVDWLVSCGQSYWQLLPMSEVGPGNSPYKSSSAFAGSILLIDPVELASHGWLSRNDLTTQLQFRNDRISYTLLKPFRMKLLRRAAMNFFSGSNDKMHGEFQEFCDKESEWLRDYALFMTISASQYWRDWSQWPKEFAQRNRQALNRMEKACTDEIQFWKFCQWCFLRQWTQLKRYANQQNIWIIGDMPIFVAYNSADVWSHQELFKLDESGHPSAIAGVPPDYFSETGQLWGNPLYSWNMHEQSDYAWWIARLRHALLQADVVRIDHFRGFVAYWEIPPVSANAITGKWQPGPGEKLFKAFEKALPHLPIIAEDLGFITPDVLALRDQFKIPGMRILQFAFSNDDNHFLPHHYVKNTVAYTGTHDNDTTLGWWNNATQHEKAFALNYLASDGEAVNWDMMRALSKSVANTVIFPMQDVLGLTGDSRMNFPGHQTGYWEWRFRWEQIQPEHTGALNEMTSKNGRIKRHF